MNPKFQSTEDLTAIEYLMESTEGTCQQRLIDRYYEFREYGMDVADSVERSELSHIYYDHDGENKVLSTIPLTVEYVHARIVEDAVKEAEVPTIQMRNIDTQDKIKIAIDLFDKYVSWGFSLAFSLQFAAVAAREILDEKYPITDEVAFYGLADFPQPIIRDAMIECYKATRKQFPEMPAQDILEAVLKWGATAVALQGIFGPVQGYGSPEEGE